MKLKNRLGLAIAILGTPITISTVTSLISFNNFKEYNHLKNLYSFNFNDIFFSFDKKNIYNFNYSFNDLLCIWNKWIYQDYVQNELINIKKHLMIKKNTILAYIEYSKSNGDWNNLNLEQQQRIENNISFISIYDKLNFIKAKNMPFILCVSIMSVFSSFLILVISFIVTKRMVFIKNNTKTKSSKQIVKKIKKNKK